MTVTGQLDGAPRASDTVVTVRVQAPGTGTDAAEGGDFQAVTPFPLTIPADRTSGTADFTFEPVDDDVDEGDERVWVVGSADVATLAVSGAENLTIIEDDAKGIVLAPSAVSPTEGETTGEQYTVALTSEPTGTVTVHADAPAGSDVRVASSGTPALTASLTFTTTNWDEPQSFTVTAVDDADGADITGLAIAHRVAGADYEGLTVDDTVAVTIDDDDQPGIHVDPATAELTEGDDVELSIKLNTLPAGTVTVTLTVPSGLSASDTTVTFTSGNWSTVQTVTVTAEHDDDALPRPTATTDFTIGFTASGADYAGVTESFALAVLEDDSEALVVEPLALEFGEGADGEITVKLASEPAGPVTVRATLSADADANVTVNPATRRFTPSNWDQTKTFTVAGAEDADSDDDTATVTFAVDAGSYAAPDVPVAVTVDDNDDPSTKVTLTVVPTGVAEDAGATTVTVTGQLDGAPRASDTVVTLRLGVPIGETDGAETGDFVPVANVPLTILADQTSGTAQFTFEPVDDDVDEGDERVWVLGEASGTTLAVSGAEDLTILEDDAKGIVLSRTAVSPTEGETTGEQYTVRLASEPTGTVTVHADAPAGSDVRVASSGTPALTASLTFTTTNWAEPQSFTVTAVDDADGTDDTGLAIAHRVAGADYEGLTVTDTVTVTIDDDDQPGIHVDPATAEVTEGDEIELSVKLNTLPAGNVTVTLTMPSGVSASDTTLTFTSGNWSTAQTVTVTAEHDDDALPRPTATTDFTIGFTASGADYGAVTESFALAVLEDDTEELVVEPLALEFLEGADGEITVKLASQPAGPVTVRATLGATPDPSVTVSPATRQFTPSNWDQTKTFTVAGAEDADSDDDTATVTFAVDAGSYAAPDVPVAVTVDDIDIPSTKVTLTVVPSAGIREDVGGAVGVQVTGTLDGAPRATPTVVTVTVSSGTATAGTDFLAVADFPLTIAAGAVTGTANMSFSVHDDDIFEGDETVTVGGSTAVGLAVDPADLTILEDDVRGIALSPSAVTVTEGETAGEQYTVRLASEPTGTVTVHADAPAGSDVRVASSGAPALTASLTFTTTNWETPQPFTVTAVEDADGEDDTGLAIAHRVAGADYEGLTVTGTVAVTIDDDDVPGIQVAADPATAMVEEGQTIDLDVKLNTQPTGNVTLTLAVPPELSADSSTLTFTTGNWSTVQTVMVTALDDDDAVADGAFTIGFAASGADYGGVMESIALTVTEDDAVGVTFAPESLTVTEEGAAGTYTAVLTSAPTARVTVRPQAPAGSDVEISPAFHRFTASNWNEPKSFSVTGLDDADSDDDVVMVAHGVTGGDYDGFVPAPYAVTVTDSDVPSTEVRLIGRAGGGRGRRRRGHGHGDGRARRRAPVLADGGHGVGGRGHRRGRGGHGRFRGGDAVHPHHPGERAERRGAVHAHAGRRRHRRGPGDALGLGDHHGADGGREPVRGGGGDARDRRRRHPRDRLVPNGAVHRRGRSGDLHGGAAKRADGAGQCHGRRLGGDGRHPRAGAPDLHSRELARAAGGDADGGGGRRRHRRNAGVPHPHGGELRLCGGDRAGPPRPCHRQRHPRDRGERDGARSRRGCRGHEPHRDLHGGARDRACRDGDGDPCRGRRARRRGGGEPGEPRLHRPQLGNGANGDGDARPGRGQTGRVGAHPAHGRLGRERLCRGEGGRCRRDGERRRQVGARRAGADRGEARLRGGHTRVAGAGRRRRVRDHGLRVRGRRRRQLDVHGLDGARAHGDRPHERADLFVPGARGQRAGGERSLEHAHRRAGAGDHLHPRGG